VKNNHRRIASLFFLLAAPLLLSACATVTRGTKDVLMIETDPPGAVVVVNGQRATTPTSFKLSRKFEGPVYITKEGYEPITVLVHSHVATAGGVGMAGNALIGGLIGAGVDYATGSTNELKPNPIKVSLVRIGEQPRPATPAMAAPAPIAGAMAPVPASAAAVSQTTTPVAEPEAAAPATELPAAGSQPLGETPNAPSPAS
jgi:hypothetical protein